MDINLESGRRRVPRPWVRLVYWCVALAVYGCWADDALGQGTIFDTDDTFIVDAPETNNNTLSFRIQCSDPNDFVIFSPSTSVGGGIVLIGQAGNVNGVTNRAGSPDIKIDTNSFTGNRDQLRTLLADGQEHFIEITGLDFTDPAWRPGLYFGGYASNFTVENTMIWNVTFNGQLIGGDPQGNDPSQLTWRGDWHYLFPVWNEQTLSWDEPTFETPRVGGTPCDENGVITIDSTAGVIRFNGTGYYQTTGQANWDESTGGSNVTVTGTGLSSYATRETDYSVWWIESAFVPNFVQGQTNAVMIGVRDVGGPNFYNVLLYRGDEPGGEDSTSCCCEKLDAIIALLEGNNVPVDEGSPEEPPYYAPDIPKPALGLEPAAKSSFKQVVLFELPGMGIRPFYLESALDLAGVHPSSVDSAVVAFGNFRETVRFFVPIVFSAFLAFRGFHRILEM